MNNLIGISVSLLSASGFNWYGFLIGGGMLLCIVLAYFMAKKRGYYSDLVFDIAICCIPCAIVGARLYYIIFDKIANPESVWSFRRIIGLEDGGLEGLAIYGGLIGACLGSLIVLALQKRKKPCDRVTFLQMADLAFPLILLGQVIGRWGNFANQEAFGNAVTNPSLQWFPYAVFIDRENGWFQATFFYESMWNLIGFAVLMWLYNGRRKSFDGFFLSLYCIWYGFGRFFIEGLRSDSLWLVPNVIRVSQLVSAIIFIFGVVFIIVHAYRARAGGKKPFLLVEESKLSPDYFGYEKSVFYLNTLKTPSAPAPEETETEPEEDRYWERGESVAHEPLERNYFGGDDSDEPGETSPQGDSDEPGKTSPHGDSDEPGKTSPHGDSRAEQNDSDENKDSGESK